MFAGRRRWLAVLGAMVLYGVGYGELWDRVLVGYFVEFSDAARTRILLGGMLLPMIVLAAVSVSYYQKGAPEPRNKVAFDAQFDFARFWNGSEPLGSIHWKALCTGALGSILAAHKVNTLASSGLPGSRIATWGLALAVVIGFHFVVSVGVWRSTTKHTVPMTIAALAWLTIAASYIVAALILLLNL